MGAPASPASAVAAAIGVAAAAVTGGPEEEAGLVAESFMEVRRWMLCMHAQTRLLHVHEHHAGHIPPSGAAHAFVEQPECAEPSLG